MKRQLRLPFLFGPPVADGLPAATRMVHAAGIAFAAQYCVFLTALKAQSALANEASSPSRFCYARPAAMGAACAMPALHPARDDPARSMEDG
jgi:hypothetical protein